MLPKDRRISPRSRVQEVMDHGTAEKRPLCIVKYLPRPYKNARFSLAVAKNLNAGNVQRNRLRRQVYEAIRLALKEGIEPKSRDYVFIIRKQIEQTTFLKLQNEIRTILSKHA